MERGGGRRRRRSLVDSGEKKKSVDASATLNRDIRGVWQMESGRRTGGTV